MTGSRLGTGYWTRKEKVSAHTDNDSTDSELTKDPFKVMKNADEGIGEGGELGYYDAAAAVRIKAKNHDRIEILPGLAAVFAGSGNNNPIVLFYSGGENIDS